MPLPPPPPGFQLDTPGPAGGQMPMSAPRPRLAAPNPYKVSEERRAESSEARAQANAARTAANEAARITMERDRLGLERQRLAADQNKDAPKPMTPQEARNLQFEMADKINAIRRIKKRVGARDGVMGIDLIPETGFGGYLASKLGGTNASDIAADIETIKSQGALTRILELMKKTGKNPFSPMANYESQLLMNSIGNLTLNQSGGSLVKQLDQYERLFSDSFLGAGGRREQLYPGLRKQPKGQPQSGPKGSPGRARVIDFNDLPE